MRPPRLFSYVVHHDLGVAPHARGRYCTLCLCKFGSLERRNVVELAEVGDWIVGTGGRSAESAGHGRIVYVMRVTNKMSLAEYSSHPRFRHRDDARLARKSRPINVRRQALISSDFYYFGRRAISIETFSSIHPRVMLEKRGPGFRSRFPAEFIADFVRWMRRHRPGVRGNPCGCDSRCAAVGTKCEAERSYETRSLVAFRNVCAAP